MKKYVFRVAMTYTTDVLCKQYTVLVQVGADTKEEALSKAKERYATYQASKFEVKHKWDWNTHKALVMLSGFADMYIWNHDTSPTDKRNP